MHPISSFQIMISLSNSAEEPDIYLVYFSPIRAYYRLVNVLTRSPVSRTMISKSLTIDKEGIEYEMVRSSHWGGGMVFFLAG